MSNGWVRAGAGFVWGLALFLAVAFGLKWVMGSTATTSPVLSQVVLKGLLIVVAVAVWALMGRPLSAMGFRRAATTGRGSLPWYALAIVAMMLGSVAMVLLELRHPLTAQMTFLQIVLSVWLLSSVSEEVYVRGLVQSWMADGTELSGPRPLSEPSVVMSALLFAAMHVPLMWSPIGFRGGLAIVLATLGVGIACAVLRARTGSLWPAILAHVLGNVGGVPGGILGVILYRVIHGHLPEMLTSG
ncbi:MAG: CPBP family intramembrane glutamic endopeptidase [Isosphaeraceae bacterium]